MKIAIGADHGGYELKTNLIAHLTASGHQVTDVGTTSTAAVDYPVFARKVAEAVASGQAQRGIMIDGAGIGSSMVANKVPGVRAAMAYDVSSARNGREHNDANLLTLGAGLIGAGLAQQSRWGRGRGVPGTTRLRRLLRERSGSAGRWRGRTGRLGWRSYWRPDRLESTRRSERGEGIPRGQVGTR